MPIKKAKSAAKPLKDADYALAEGKAWIEVGPFAIRIVKTDEGVVVDIYPNGREDEDCIASCYAFDTEAEQVPEGS